MARRRDVLRLAAAALAAGAALAGGCAHPQLFDMGTTEQEVVAEIGEPDARTEMPDGTLRYTYSMQPMGLECWWLFFRDGRLEGREQAMKDEAFGLVKPGMKIEEAFALFGKPAQIYDFKFLRESAYMYRFKGFSMRVMAFWVQYDRAGVVTETAVTTDPWTDARPLGG